MRKDGRSTQRLLNYESLYSARAPGSALEIDPLAGYPDSGPLADYGSDRDSGPSRDSGQSEHHIAYHCRRAPSCPSAGAVGAAGVVGVVGAVGAAAGAGAD